MSPYRSSSPPTEAPKTVSWKPHWWTRLRRRLMLFGRKSFRERYPVRCRVCLKPSNFTTTRGERNFLVHYEPCKHIVPFFEKVMGDLEVKRL